MSTTDVTHRERRRPGPAGRIAKVETLTLGTAWRDLAFARVHTDEGLVGIGEITHPYRQREVCLLIEHMANRHLLGADPFDVEDVWQRMFQGDYFRGGDVGGVAVSGIDQALYDIMGRALDVPAYRLLGGACRDRVPVYANGWYRGERDAETFAALARGVLERGFGALKVDPFGPGRQELTSSERRRSLELVEAIRDAIGPDAELFIEGHARFAVVEARRLAVELQRFDVGWFEEPLPWTNIEEYPLVRDAAVVPIAGGEHFHNRFEFRRLFDLAAVSVVQPDVVLAGGLTETRKIAAMADTRGIVVAPHNSQSPLCTTVTAHLAFGLPNFKILETFDHAFEPYVFEAISGVLPIEGGSIGLPERPGFGVELVDAVFEQHPPTYAHWDLFAEGWEQRNRR